MNKYTKIPLIALIVVLVGMTACESPTAVDSTDGTLTSDQVAFENAEITTMLESELSLTAVESGTIEAEIATVSTVRREPGWRWTLAARLQQALTDEQKARLIARTERFEEKDVFGLVCFVGPGGLTGPDWKGEPGVFGRIHLVRVINDLLTDVQKEQVRAILGTYHEQVRELVRLVKAQEITREEFREELESIIADVIAQVRDLLTDEQVATLEARLEERQQRFEELVEATKAAMYAALSATDPQIRAMGSLCERLTTEKDALFAQFDEGALSREELKDALNVLNQLEYAELATILDEAQFEIVQLHKALTLRWRRVALGLHRDRISGEFNSGSGGPIFGGHGQRG
ncbi:MAG: hypothetical protein KDD65_08770 [Bacteroidetes bacterium]|nr:hypothetical protein [Bacteroidota bacterium]